MMAWAHFRRTTKPPVDNMPAASGEASGRQKRVRKKKAKFVGKGGSNIYVQGLPIDLDEVWHRWHIEWFPAILLWLRWIGALASSSAACEYGQVIRPTNCLLRTGRADSGGERVFQGGGCSEG